MEWLVREGFLKELLPELGFDRKIRHCPNYLLSANTQVFSGESYPLFNPSLAELLVVLTSLTLLWWIIKYFKFCLTVAAALTHYLLHLIPAVFQLHGSSPLYLRGNIYLEKLNELAKVT